MRLEPYDEPRQPGFRRPRFRRSTRRWKPRIERLVAGCWRGGPGGIWVYPSVRPGLPRESPHDGRPWGWKLYVCVAPRSYWLRVHRLVSELGSAVEWKLYLAGTGYERPDKIVLYAASPAALARLIRRLRPLLGSRGFHDLRHAAPAWRLGLERGRRGGFFVGCDPRFLRRTSWRLYRSLCAAWAGLNAEYLAALPGGRARWLRRMNLSPDHEGPASLAPDPRDIAYIRRYWRIIGTPSAPARRGR